MPGHLEHPYGPSLTSLGISTFPFKTRQDIGGLHSNFEALLESALLAAFPRFGINDAHLPLGTFETSISVPLNGSSEECTTAVTHPSSSVVTVFPSGLSTHIA